MRVASTISAIQVAILLGATTVLYVLQGWAFIDAVSHRAEAYTAADKQTKTTWLVILGVALVAHMLIWHPINLLNIAGAVASIVYLVDVRPTLQSLTRR